jgi:hypothetical protein
MLLTPNIEATLTAKAVPTACATPPFVVKATAAAAGTAAKNAIRCETPLKRGFGA